MKTIIIILCVVSFLVGVIVMGSYILIWEHIRPGQYLKIAYYNNGTLYYIAQHVPLPKLNGDSVVKTSLVPGHRLEISLYSETK